MAWVDWTVIGKNSVINDEPLEEAKDNIDWLYTDLGINYQGCGAECGADWPSYFTDIKGQAEEGANAYVISGGDGIRSAYSSLRARGNYMYDNACGTHNTNVLTDENATTQSSANPITHSTTQSSANPITHAITQSSANPITDAVTQASANPLTHAVTQASANPLTHAATNGSN
jgi:hypothetical protein